MKFETVKIEMTKMNFETEIDDKKDNGESSIQLEVGNIRDNKEQEKVIVQATTIANYEDERFWISAEFKGHFILEDIEHLELEKSTDMQEELGTKILEKIYNKLNMYVSILSQEVYATPIYPSKITIGLKKSEE